MQGLMMGTPLLISSLIKHADQNHGDTEIVSRRVEGDIHRYNWHECHTRSRQFANLLKKLAVKDGDRVATLAWNGYRHLEVYFGTSGIGSVLHTVNPRLFPEQIAWILNHAEDSVMLFDLTFMPIVEAIAPLCPTVKHWIALADRAHMPQSKIAGLLCYEEQLALCDDQIEWPSFDENKASSLCYTSGTTGNPKGVLYSHRSTVLHSFAIALPDALNLSARDCVLPVVPMFHVNAWGLPYATAMVGSKLVMPGPNLDGKSLFDLFENEKVTLSAGVPTVWLGLLNHVRQNGLRFGSMKRTVVGGSACPPAMLRSFQHDYGVQVLHAWGMTEMSPVGTCGVLKGKHEDLPAEQRYAIQSKQGRPIFGVELKIVDAEGIELPWDDVAYGDLLVRGPWVVEKYFKNEGGDPLRDGWFPTGDVATIDPDGFVHITDRSKDVIKSGGEWIGSIDLENIAMAHPAVAMAAVIAVYHPKWDERPLLVVVKKPDVNVTREELLLHYEGKIAKWWMPDDVVFVDAIPLGATGKMLKNRLREQFKGYTLPTAA
jgi:fatty-acyl-CoA synthase